MSTSDAEALLKDARRKQERAQAVARRARLKLGVETGSRRGGELFYTDGRGALGWLYEDGEAPDLVVRDSCTIKQMFRLWKRYPRRVSRGTSSIRLPSGRSVVYDHKKGEILRP
jgi:hypothetical protein